jgi:hypothetical protein
VQYVVVHADRFPNQGADVIAAARASADYRLVTSIGADYLFEVTGTSASVRLNAITTSAGHN